MLWRPWSGWWPLADVRDLADIQSGVPASLDRRYLLEPDPGTLPCRDVGVLVIGSGIAGLVAALEVAVQRPVTLVTKDALRMTGTWYAQGGIAGAVGEADSVELHLADTLVVGQGLCDPEMVRAVVGEAPEALRSLSALGVGFDRAQDGEMSLHLEGGHSLPRVLHSGDATGAAVQRALAEAVESHPSIEVIEHHFLVDLVTVGDACVGAIFLDPPDAELSVLRADATVLATGGLGQLYRITTNPRVATGDGLAAAWRAGADLADLEFVQFHPTALDHETEPRFLITEALRGDGAYLLDCDLKRFMLDAHPLAELAPRDVVSREIEKVMARCGRRNVWLDARHLGRERLAQRFPTIVAACEEAGWDLSEDLLPVAPAAHYAIGGVKVDIDGRTSLCGLYASGEAAASGLHGANRLASNSLLEGLVLSRRIARRLACDTPMPAEATQFDRGDVPAHPAKLVPDADIRERLRDVMSSAVGMSRAAEPLADALTGISSLAAGHATLPTVGSLEASAMLTVSALVAASALDREESRGVHARRDFPLRDDDDWRGHIVSRRGQGSRFEQIGT